MQENDVLDDLQENQSQPPSGQFQRALRFLLYALGIIVVLLGRMMMSRWQINEAQQFLLVGGAGVWLFSGLGLSALFQARKERQTDLLFALITLGHLLIFSFSSIYLASSFRTILSI